MTDTTSGNEGAALDLFEAFLTRYHEGEESEVGTRTFSSLCAGHPEHAERFQRWWDQLVQTGEVSETPAGEKVVDLPEEGGRFGSYKIVRELGRGSQGTVFLAEDLRLSRRIALKILPAYRGNGKDRSRRFAREAELASRLDHPGLCAVFERGMMGSTAYLAMRYVEGETLAAAVARARRESEVDARSRVIRIGDGSGNPVHAVLRMFEAVAAALGAAHEANLIHRDVKPGNIVVGPDGKPVLLDFGLARDVKSDMLTMTGDLLGTPAYMSPEQLAAHRIELDHRTDIYSLGATLYECLTLHRPFEAPTRNELYQQILVSEPTPPRRHNPDLDRDLEIVLQTALDKDRNRRYQSAADFAEDLRRVREFEPIRARRAGPVLRFRRWVQRNPTTAVSAIVVFSALAIGLAVSQYFFTQARHYQSAFERLADQGHLDNAKITAAALLPFDAGKVGAIQDWLERYGRPLRDRLPGLRESIVQLRKRGVPVTASLRERLRENPDKIELDRLRSEIEVYRSGIEKARMKVVRDGILYRVGKSEERCRELEALLAVWQPLTFPAPEDDAVHASITQLIAELEEFVSEGGLLRRMEAHVDWNRRVQLETVERYADAWRSAQAKAQEIYGKELPVQPGLVPLGVSQHGLLEFAHVRSGALPTLDTEKDPEKKEYGVGADGGLVFVLVAGGGYSLNRFPAPNLSQHERGRSDVELDWFFVSKYEMTRGQWRRLARREPPGHDIVLGSGCGEDDHPVESVLWQEAVDLLDEHGLKLPTEAQWEYAALGGRAAPWSWSRREHRSGVPMANVRDVAFLEAGGLPPLRAPFDDKYVLTSPVGVFPPNGFGLHDVHGNVSEWCLEPFVAISLSHLPNRKGDGYHFAPLLSERTSRGGACDTKLQGTYAARRFGRQISERHMLVGVRPVRAVRTSR